MSEAEELKVLKARYVGLKDKYVKLEDVVEAIKAQIHFHGIDSVTIGVQKALKSLDEL